MNSTEKRHLCLLESRRVDLLRRCIAVDRLAARRRELGESLTESERYGFAAMTELRVCERQIAKMKEVKR